MLADRREDYRAKCGRVQREVSLPERRCELCSKKRRLSAASGRKHCYACTRMKSATPQQQVSYWRRMKPRKRAKGVPRLTRKLKLWNNACAWVRETMRPEGYKRRLTLKADGEGYISLVLHVREEALWRIVSTISVCRLLLLVAHPAFADARQQCG